MVNNKDTYPTLIVEIDRSLSLFVEREGIVESHGGTLPQHGLGSFKMGTAQLTVLVNDVAADDVTDDADAFFT